MGANDILVSGAVIVVEDERRAVLLLVALIRCHKLVCLRVAASGGSLGRSGVEVGDLFGKIVWEAAYNTKHIGQYIEKSCGRSKWVPKIPSDFLSFLVWPTLMKALQPINYLL